MNIAVLFNSGDPSLRGWYGGSILEMILKTDVLQHSEREMRIMVGDILTFSARDLGIKTYADWAMLTSNVLVPIGWFRLNEKKLQSVLGANTIYTWVFQNMTLSIAEMLTKALWRKRAFLGALQIDFSNSLHLRFFRNSLIERYRIHGRVCTEFYHMGENEDPDVAVRELFERHSFTVEYEDMGARRTIFDNYDNLQHFRRVSDFGRIYVDLLGGSEEISSEVSLVLEELHPGLFDVLASSVRALERAETPEDLAQIALSGRRFLEALADYLYPASDKPFEGRQVKKENYRNRLWAYIKTTMVTAAKFEERKLQALGKEVDRLIEAFNAGLHHRPVREKITASIRDLVAWVGNLSKIDRRSFRRPYLAYTEELHVFMLDVLNQNEKIAPT